MAADDSTPTVDPHRRSRGESASTAFVLVLSVLVAGTIAVTGWAVAGDGAMAIEPGDGEDGLDTVEQRGYAAESHLDGERSEPRGVDDADDGASDERGSEADVPGNGDEATRDGGGDTDERERDGDEEPDRREGTDRGAEDDWGADERDEDDQDDDERVGNGRDGERSEDRRDGLLGALWEAFSGGDGDGEDEDARAERDGGDD